MREDARQREVVGKGPKEGKWREYPVLTPATDSRDPGGGPEHQENTRRM